MWTELNHFLVSLYMRTKIHRDEGQALVEYALILALISIVAALTLTELGANVAAKLVEVQEGISM